MQARNKRAIPSLCLFARLIFNHPYERDVFLRNIGSCNGLQGAISLKMATFITTAVRSSNPVIMMKVKFQINCAVSGRYV
jgi:hypothetical protein